MDLISIIVPVYNVEEYIDLCVESLLAQTYNNIEIILINDGSTDASGKKCDAWKEKDDRIIVIHKENGGVSSARNAGLNVAKGKYIAYTDPDDYCEAGKLQRLYDVMIEHDSDLACCSFYSKYHNACIKHGLPYETGCYLVKDIYTSMFFGEKNDKNITLNASLVLGLFKKDIIEKNNIRFDENITLSEDVLFYAQYVGYCRSIALVNENLYYYVQRNSSLTHKYEPASKEKLDKEIYALEKFCEIADAHNIDRELYSKHIHISYLEKVLRQAINVWHIKNTSDLGSKIGFIKYSIEATKIKQRIEKTDSEKLSKKYRLLTLILKTNNLFLLSVWAIVFNFAKGVKYTFIK